MFCGILDPCYADHDPDDMIYLVTIFRWMRDASVAPFQIKPVTQQSPPVR